MGRSPSSSEENELIKKGPWTPEEDRKLVDYIERNGHGSWRALPKLAGLNRCGKSCRLRWTNYLRPDIKRGKFSEEEERIIINLHEVLGNKWSAIASHLPGRTDNEIKNFWNTHLRKKLLQMGIDPVTHRPRTDHLNLLLANLPQLLAASNFTNSLINNWDINALRLHSDATQLAKIQLLQNILQVLNTNHVPNLMESINNSPFGSSTASSISNQFHDYSNLLNLEVSMGPQQQQQPLCTSSGGQLGGSTGGLAPDLLPSLISASPDEYNIVENQMENKTVNLTTKDVSNPSSTLNSTTFEAWGDFTDDIEATDDHSNYWKDIIEQASSQSWTMS